MVAIALDQNFNMQGKWWGYLAISLCVNVMLVSAVNISRNPHVMPAMPSIKVNLMSLAAPAPQPSQAQLEQPSSQVMPKKLVTEQHADKKIASAEAVKQQPLQKMEETKPASISSSDVTPAMTQGQDHSTVIHEADYRKQTPPIYPRRAFELGQEGTVMLHAKVMPTGIPRELKIAESSGYRLLDMAALEAVKQWEFEPTIINGNASPSWVRVPVRFVIQ